MLSFLEVSEVARALECSADAVLSAVARGVLLPIGRTGRGVHLFSPESVSAYKRSRDLEAQAFRRSHGETLNAENAALRVIRGAREVRNATKGAPLSKSAQRGIRQAARVLKMEAADAAALYRELGVEEGK